MDLKRFNDIYSAWVISSDLMTYQKMYNYYCGKTDAITNYKMITERSNCKIHVNYIKKFIKEEVSYSLGNEVMYLSKDDNKEMIDDIEYYMSHWNENHDCELLKNMLIYSNAFELYYIDENGDFSSKIVPPTQGFGVVDDAGNIVTFLRQYAKPLDETVYIDVYEGSKVYHMTANGTQLGSSDSGFSSVPVAWGNLTEDGIFDTLYWDLKGLQDGYETNLSDICNEISDFRNAYLKLTGCGIEEKQLAELKRLGMINIPIKDGDADWLIKNINDTFIQNTLKTMEDKMYQISSHINHNEKMQSNTSSLALRSRLISLEEKCKLNQKSVSNVLKTRLQFLFEYIKTIKNKEYDVKQVKLKFTPNIPQDDLMTAQIISQLGDLLSEETSLSLLSFIENAQIEKAKKDNEESEMKAGLELLGVENKDE